MKVYRLGRGEVDFPELVAETEPFAVDAVLLVADEKSLTDEQRDLLALYRRYGRPVVSSAEAAADLPRTNYRPIDCGFYDHFEAAIVQRRSVELEYLLPDGTPTTKTIRPLDLKTHRAEEYVLLEGDGWLRLDRIVSMDGTAAGESCSF